MNQEPLEETRPIDFRQVAGGCGKAEKKRKEMAPITR